MLPNLVSNSGPLTYESGALPIALPGPAREKSGNFEVDDKWFKFNYFHLCCSKC